MASTLTRGPGLGQNGASRSVGIDPGRHRRRSLPLALVALGCMAVSIAAFVGLQLAASDRAAVLAVARPVAAGTAISDDDLTVAQVSTDPALAPIPLSARASVLGRTAAVDLAPGTLLVDSVLGQARGLDAGEAIVGVAVAAGAAPVQTLAVGDRVQLVETPAPGAATAAGSGRSVLAEGRVTDLARGSGSSSSTGLQLAVAVPAAAAPSIAASAAEGRIAVVVLP